MATRRSLYSDYLNTWATKLQTEGALTVGQKALIDSDLAIDDFHEAISKLKPVVTGALSTLVLNKMDLIQTDEGLLDEEVQTAMSIHIDGVEPHREYCYKEFSYSATTGDLCIITTARIKSSIQKGSFNDGDWKILEQMMLKDVTRCDFLYGLAQDLSQDKKNIYVLTGLADPDVWRLYAYAYLCHINKESVVIPPILSYPSSTKFTNTDITYKNDVLYEQYFEAYHVMNEAKHVEDILSRYLRMYQVLELFVYRQTLVSIEKQNNKNSAFVRNVIKEAFKTGSEEKKQFVEGMPKVFPSLAIKITQGDIAPYDNFLDSTYLIKSGDPHNAKKIAKIIYALRNSVVHNKESELHFSFGNVDEYQAGINLMKVILPKMEETIVETINTPHCPISFTKDVMPLY